MTWRLLSSPVAHGAWNMAVDEAVMLSIADGASPPTLRLYGWSPGCYSIGRFQRASDLTGEARTAPGVSWVRRPTGGRALYHGLELTYSVVASLSDEHVAGAVPQSCCKIAEALAAGLRTQGVDACLAPRADPVRLRGNPSCFDNPSAHELLHQGRKLVGSAQLRHRGVLLQHGSILLDSPAMSFFAGLHFETDEERRAARSRSEARLTTLAEATGCTPDAGRVSAAVVSGFVESWDIEFIMDGLTEREDAKARELEERKYRSVEWSYLK